MSTHWTRVWGLGAVIATLLTAQNQGTTTYTQPAPPTPAQLAARQVAMLTAILSLTSAQQSAAATIFTTEETTVATLRTSITQDRSSLQTAIEANDTASIETDSTAIGNLEGQSVLARAQADAAFYQLLTSDQQTKYQQLLQTGALGHGPRGPGGPPPSGGVGR